MVIMLTVFLRYWQHFAVIESSKSTTHQCIHNNSKELEFKFITDSLVGFEIFFV